jgi:hypothetical protein
MANNYKNTEKAFRAFGDKVVKTARGILNAKGINTKGNLYDSIGYYLKVYPSGSMELDFLMEGYGRIVDEGARGRDSSAKAPRSPFKYSKMPPVSVIEQWLKDKGIQARDMGYTKKDGTKVKGTGRFIKRKQGAYAIAKGIQLYGKEPTYFFRDAFDQGYKGLSKNIIKAYARDAEKFLAFVSKEI